MEKIAGKYEVIRELGSGSSGQVFLVQHPDLNIQFALKLLHTASSDDQRFIDQFKREAEVLLRFSHEGCVQLRDFGRIDSGRYYMATDFCEGGTLRDLLNKKGQLEPRVAIQILVQLLEVLAAAHDRSIIHRDIKPENLMLQKDHRGRDLVKVLDFGIAKLLEIEQEGEQEDGGDAGSLGTPGYISPEQAYGEKNLDGRTDIYSAGVVAYEMLTGQTPFAGESVVQTLLAHITQPPPPFAEKCGLPPALERLVLKALEKSKQDRYADARAFQDECIIVLDVLDDGTGNGPKLNTRSPASLYRSSIDTPTAATIQTTPVNSTRILLLDDETTILNLMKHILESEGYTVFTAHDCSSIHPYLFNEDIKLMITDVQMPDIPGWKICRMLKESVDDLKIILFSNLPDRELQQLHKDSLADAWMSKGTKPQEWIKIIKDVLAAP